ncbi:hypothetical protein CEXT_451861 [Caerostris extrusa]|uniref:Uncharacterized protein n=1 Tax=Caerostris extrusa TaxID=172846 RepID=A0AAV4PB35_CAEEX|nr:hypothetical protein CEXT_451861 [Caerostris extrusa]
MESAKASNWTPIVITEQIISPKCESAVIRVISTRDKWRPLSGRMRSRMNRNRGGSRLDERANEVFA